MSKVVSFVRNNENNLEYAKIQKDIILEYIKEKKINLDEHIEVSVNIPCEEKNVLNKIKECKKECTVIIANLNIFARTTEGVLEALDILLSKNIRVIAIKQNIDLVNKDDMLTKMILGVMKMTISLEKDLMSIRTKEALTAKKIEGIHLGKPKGTIQKSKFDKQRDKIEELLSVGLSVRKIAKLLGYNNHIGLNNYVKKRNIREKISSTDFSIAS